MGLLSSAYLGLLVEGRASGAEKDIGGFDRVRYINMRSDCISVGCGEGEERAGGRRE